MRRICTNNLKRWAAALTPTLALALVAGGCGDPSAEESPEVAEIAAALELENGGLDMEDEAPMFGAELEFDSAGLMLDEIPNTDLLESDPAIAAMMVAPDAAIYRTTLLWGQIPGDPTNSVPRNWSGVIRISRGALLVRSVIAFEGPTDNLLPRTDPREVRFTSATLPHLDGLRLAVVDPTPELGPIGLHYESVNGVVVELPLQGLLDGPSVLDMDAAGNRMVGVAMVRPVDLCNNGFLGGRWHRVAEGRGRIIGHVVDANGDPRGHVRGVYGHRLNGEQVFFGKYINLAGEFRGIFAGHYDNGTFEGRWLVRSGDQGALGGMYRESIPGPETGGELIGRWAETSCNLDVGPGAP